MRPLHVLVVDDEPSLRRSLARALMARGLLVDTAEGGDAALDLVRTRDVDAVLLDHEMPPPDGLTVLAHLRRHHPDVEVVLMAALGDEATAQAALANGAFAVVPKPLPSVELAAPPLERAAERRRLVQRARALEQQVAEHEQLGDVVTTSPRMEELLRRAWSAAASASPVLILGERGTGKDLLARAIHRRSPRGRAPMVVLSPAALPAEAVEGALSAALGDADGATLLVDDLGALPRPAQAEILRVIAGGHDVRLIATALPDLRDQVERGEVRQDLFYRAATILLEVPPLRRRREDIPLLAYHFLNRYAARENKPIRRIGVEALRKLREHGWPGNVSELRAAVEHAVVMARGEVIVPSDLPFAERPVSDDEEGPAPLFASAEVLEMPYAEAKDQAVSAFDHTYVTRLMKRAGGNVSEAARLAGMDRSNFRRLMKKALGE